VTRKSLSILLLNIGAGLMLVGGVGDLLVLAPPAIWAASIGQPVDSLGPGLARFLLALLHALGSALVASSIALLFLINRPLRRGEPWAGPAIALVVLFSDVMNAFQIYLSGGWYFWFPLSFACVVLIGLLVGFVPSFVFARDQAQAAR
jgi:hypothetical protein